jgi:hypothetical protein
MSEKTAPIIKYDPDKLADALLGLSGDLRKAGCPMLEAAAKRLNEQVKAARIKA